MTPALLWSVGIDVNRRASEAIVIVEGDRCAPGITTAAAPLPLRHWLAERSMPAACGPFAEHLHALPLPPTTATRPCCVLMPAGSQRGLPGSEWRTRCRPRGRRPKPAVGAWWHCLQPARLASTPQCARWPAWPALRRLQLRALGSRCGTACTGRCQAGSCDRRASSAGATAGRARAAPRAHKFISCSIDDGATQ